jgi:rhodanese-related sulfurtransferase
MEANSMYIILAVAVLIIVLLITKHRKGIKGMYQINPEAAYELIKDSNVSIIDVRSPEEFKSGHIKGARLIPVSVLDSRIDELRDLKEKNVLVYCHSGGRSSMACQILLKRDFKNVSNLQGGVMGWTNKGFKLV